MGYLMVFLLVGGSAVLIKFFAERGTGGLAGLISTLPIRVVYLLALVAIANDRRLAESTLQGVVGGLAAIFLLGISALVALRFFGTRTSIVIGLGVWVIAVATVSLLQRGS